MVDRIKNVGASDICANSANESLGRNNSVADNIFSKIDTSNDGVASVQEIRDFGFTTLGDKPLSKAQFSTLFQQFMNNTGSIKSLLKPFSDIFYGGVNEPSFIHDVKLSPEQQKELLSRMEMFDAYYSTLKPEEKEEILKIKSDMMCFNNFRENKPVPEDYDLPDEKKGKNITSLKGLPDYKYVQIKDFINGDYKKLKAELKEGKNDYTISNAMLAKYLKLASVNEFVSDGKIGGFRQGAVGDCWFLSSLMSYASTPEGEKNITDRIKKNDDGSYTVSFNNPFEQTKKETYTVSAKELSNYRRVKKNFDEKEKTFSSGDIDVRVLEIAMNKLLDKYIPPEEYEKGDLPIEGSSYLKESIVHKALGYTSNIRYYYYANKAETNPVFINKIINLVGDIALGENGKAKVTNEQYYTIDIRSLVDMAESFGFKDHELRCGANKGRQYQNEKDKKFMSDQHAYNMMKTNEQSVVISNPGYSSFPHTVKRNLYQNGNNFFDDIVYLPQDSLIPIQKCK